MRLMHIRELPNSTHRIPISKLGCSCFVTAAQTVLRQAKHQCRRMFILRRTRLPEQLVLPVLSGQVQAQQRLSLLSRCSTMALLQGLRVLTRGVQESLISILLPSHPIPMPLIGSPFVGRLPRFPGSPVLAKNNR
jgi:hypothetical protein